MAASASDPFRRGVVEGERYGRGGENRGGDNHAAEHNVKSPRVVTVFQTVKRQRTQQHAGNAASQQEAENAHVHLPAKCVRRYRDNFNDCAKSQGCADCGGRRDAKEQYENRRGHAACADACQRDGERDYETKNEFHLLVSLRDMNAAFEFTPSPAAGACVPRVGRESRAGFATDAGIAGLIKRQKWDVVLFGEIPNIFV